MTARLSRAAVGVAAGGSAFAVVVAVLVCAALVVNATEPSAEQQAQTSADRELSRHYDSALDRDPREVDVDVRDHPFYDMDVPKGIDCELPDLDATSESSWDDFSEEIRSCLDEFWQPRLEELGLRTDTPEFDVTSSDPDNPAQQGMTLAYYDNEEKKITVVLPNVTKLARSFPKKHQESVWSALLSHEYGHHVQHAIGVLDKSVEMQKDARSEPEALGALRRTELQAECMGGVAMNGFGTFDDSELDKINKLLNGGSDLPTHGSSRNRQHWFDKGKSLDAMGDCNTFDAKPSSVN